MNNVEFEEQFKEFRGHFGGLSILLKRSIDVNEIGGISGNHATHK